jgi:hypothetical protein
MSSDGESEMRRKSMQGTLLFALGISGAIVFAVTGTVWVIVAAVVFLVAGVLMLYQVGKSLS